MKVNLKCFSTLVIPDTCDFTEITTYELDDGQTLKDLVQRAGIDGEDIKIAFVNSRKVDLDTVLSDRDQVGLAPAVGGM
jgi:molybdopterin converting factor small subunit